VAKNEIQRYKIQRYKGTVWSHDTELFALYG